MSKTVPYFWRRKSTYHESMIYLCEKCDYYFGFPQVLSLHIDAKHECVSYKCDQCNQILVYKPYLPSHQKSKYDDLKNDDDFKNKDDLKNEDDLIIIMTSKMKKT